jgi:hypothetical protein
MYVCIFIYLYVCIFIYLYVCIYIYMYIYIYIYIYVYTNIYICIHIHVYIHIHIYTYRPLHACLLSICSSIAYLSGDALGAVSCLRASIRENYIAGTDIYIYVIMNMTCPYI